MRSRQVIPDLLKHQRTDEFLGADGNRQKAASENTGNKVSAFPHVSVTVRSMGARGIRSRGQAKGDESGVADPVGEFIGAWDLRTGEAVSSESNPQIARSHGRRLNKP